MELQQTMRRVEVWECRGGVLVPPGLLLRGGVGQGCMGAPRWTSHAWHTGMLESVVVKCAMHVEGTVIGNGQHMLLVRGQGCTVRDKGPICLCLNKAVKTNGMAVCRGRWGRLGGAGKMRCENGRLDGANCSNVVRSSCCLLSSNVVQVDRCTCQLSS